jgi:hypothetical protein
MSRIFTKAIARRLEALLERAAKANSGDCDLLNALESEGMQTFSLEELTELERAAKRSPQGCASLSPEQCARWRQRVDEISMRRYRRTYAELCELPKVLSNVLPRPKRER